MQNKDQHALALTVLPYTTLFRSLHQPYGRDLRNLVAKVAGPAPCDPKQITLLHRLLGETFAAEQAVQQRDLLGVTRGWRSEEHTSELQSRLHLVCRPLLEQKNIA